MSKTVQEEISKAANTKDLRKVELTDTVCVGCDNCGSCCIKTTMILDPFDVYRIAKKCGIKELLDNSVFYSGNTTGLPIIELQPSKDTGMCCYLKATNNGDYVCSLEEYKPLKCSYPFIAVATSITDKEFDFVPFDKEVPKIDIEQFIKKYESADLLYFLDEENNKCEAKNKKNILVSEYISERIKYSKEHCISNLVSMLLCRYINVRKMSRLLYLSEHSSLNVEEKKSVIGALNMYDKITTSMYSDIYFYFDPDKDESFMEQTIKHINFLEDKKYPMLRILYKYLLKVFDPSNTILDEILNTENVKLAQERFDNYFSSNINIIKNRFYNDEFLNMMKDAVNQRAKNK